MDITDVRIVSTQCAPLIAAMSTQEKFGDGINYLCLQTGK